MAAPSGSGATLVGGVATTMGAPTWPSVLAAGTLTAEPGTGSWRVSQLNPPSGTVYGGKIVLPSALNFTNRFLTTGTPAATQNLINISSSATALGGLMIALIDADGDGARWSVSGPNERDSLLATDLPIVIKPASTTSRQSTLGTFDITRVKEIEIHISSFTGGTRQALVNRFFSVEEIILSGGEIGNPARFSSLIDYQASVTQLKIFRRLSNSMIVSTVPVKIAADRFEASGDALEFIEKANFTSPPRARNHFEDGELKISYAIPASGIAIVSSSQIKGVTRFSDSASIGIGATLSMLSTLIRNVSNRELKAGEIYLGSTISTFEQLTINGADLDGLNISGGTSNPSLIVQSLGANKRFTALGLAGSIRIDLPPGDYPDLEAQVSTEQVFNITQGTGTYDLSGITGGTVGDPVVFDNTGGGAVVVVVGEGIEAVADPTPTNGTIAVIKPQFVISGFPTGANVNGIPYEAVLGIRNTSDNTLYTADASSGSVVVLLGNIGDGIGPFLVWGDGHGVRRTISVSVLVTRIDDLDLSEFFEEFTAEDGTVLVGLAPADTGVTYEQGTALFLFGVGAHKFLGVLSQFDALTSTQAGQAYNNAAVRAIEFVSNAFTNTIFLPAPFRIAAVENAASSPALADFRVIRPDLSDARAYGLSSTLYAERPVVGFPYAYVVSALTAAQSGQLEALHGTLQSSGETIEAFTSQALAAAPAPSGGGLGPEDIERLERIEQQLIADVVKGRDRYQRLLPGTSTVILDQDVVYDPVTGFTLTEHEEPPP